MTNVGSAPMGAFTRPRVLLVDRALTRRGIRIALDGAVEVCAETSTGDEAVAMAERQQPDVCIVGIEVLNGWFAAVRGITSVSPGTAVIVLADSPDIDGLLTCVRAGALGYLPSSIGRTALRRAVSAVARGEAAIPRSMVLELMRELRGSVERDGLTAREAQVLALVRRGQPTAAIARQLGISPVTVRRHISTMVHKRDSMTVGADSK